ncbi:hypothetical protein [Gordonia sp. MP11Mi]|uniref:TM2 domain-containing protein n=1 Tax=Gordonia sp. MP11Mi TaxID=3022769 RepID=A0AA97CX69_9ACTN
MPYDGGQAGSGQFGTNPLPPVPVQPMQPHPQGQPYPHGGVDPSTGIPFSDKTKVAAGLLQLFLGGLGAGRWYVGTYGIAATQLILWIVGWLLSFVIIGIPILIGVWLWVLIDAIMMFTGSVRDGAAAHCGSSVRAGAERARS